MAVDGDFVLFEILVPMWKWFTCVALAGGALDILLSQAMHGSDVHRTPYGALIKAWI
jgi:predicted ATP-grasp superfamily ATP-dependent carboligase